MMKAESAAIDSGHPQTDNPIEEALRNGLNFYPKNKNIDLGAFEAYNEVGGPPGKGSEKEEEGEEDSKATAINNAGKLDLDDDLNLL